MRREVFESQEFTQQLGQLGNIKRLDERLNILTWSLWLDAEDYPLIAEGNRMRVAEILGFEGDPTLSVWFEIDNENRVMLHWIEITENEA